MHRALECCPRLVVVEPGSGACREVSAGVREISAAHTSEGRAERHSRENDVRKTGRLTDLPALPAAGEAHKGRTT